MTDLNNSELKNKEPRLYSAALFALDADKDKVFAIINIHHEIYLLKQRAKDLTLSRIRLEFWRNCINENKFSDLGPIGHRIKDLNLEVADWNIIFESYENAFDTNNSLDFIIAYAVFSLKALAIDFLVQDNIKDLNIELIGKDKSRILPIIAPIALAIKKPDLIQYESIKDIGLRAKFYLFFIMLCGKL